MTATPPASKKTPAKEIVTLSIAAAKAKLTPAALEAVKTWLGEQFLANMYAKLGQGGDEEGHIALRQVFVDLPVGLGINDETGEETRGRFLKSFLAAKPIKLGLIARTEQSLPEFDADRQEMRGNIHRFAGKQPRDDRLSATLLIGGPGQGKSTLGQLACQLHRAALLQPFSAALSTRHQELLTSFYEQSSKENDQAATLVPPAKPFLPLQISLPDFAAWLAKKAAQPQQAKPPINESSPPSLEPMPLILQFLTELPSAQTCKLEANTLLALTAHIPILLVLDGFDEVGAGKDRERLVLAARELLTMLAQQASTIQVLATTRPQGYAGELAQIGVLLHPCQLALLHKKEALHYAEKLVNAKIPGADERHQILSRLEDAANEPATQRLLTTPLQVTILSALVQQSGRAPRERWNLFEKYFSYTYSREIVHNTYASNLLSDHRQHIIQIHARVALLLQVESERDGGAAARMTQQRLEEVINEVLLEDGIADDERLTLVREITVAAGQRLVFLVEPEPGSFGFEIRSLQEFMAAWALTSGRESDLEERLHTVARTAMFRNVTLFIASKFFSEGSALRDVFADRICPAMNDDDQDELARQSFAGSLLALEILEEGAVLMQPNRARALMVCACKLLALPPTDEQIRLFFIANKDIYPVFHRALEQGLSQANQFQVTAWRCLLMAVAYKRDGALALAERYWQKLTAPRLLLQDLTKHGMSIGPWLSDKIAQNAEQFSPVDFINTSTTGNNWVGWLSGVFASRQSRFIHQNWVGSSVSQLDEQWTTEPEAATLPTTWLPWVVAARFECAPSANKLAVALLAIADALPQTEWQKLQNHAAWPLAVCLRTANTPDDLRKFAQQAQAGVLGDASEWLAAEKNWSAEAKIFDIKMLITLWSLDSLQHQLPLFILQAGQLTAHFLSAHTMGKNFLIMLDKAMQATASHNLQKWLIDLCVGLSDIGRLAAKQTKPYIQKWLIQFKQIDSYLIPRPFFLPHEAWMEALDAVADIAIQQRLHGPFAVFQAINEAEGHPKVLRQLIKVIVLYRFTIEQLTKFEGFKEFQHFLHKIKQQSTAYVGADWKMLQLFVGIGAPEQDYALFEEIETAARHSPIIWKEFIIILKLAQLSQHRLSRLLGQLWANPIAKQFAANEIIGLMREQLETRKSGLDKHTTWNRLNLRLPHPLQTLPQVQQAALPTHLVHIAALELKDIRALHQLKLEFPPPPENFGQWVVILGQNGVGKTTLLRSLALALRNTANLAIWPKGVFSNNWLRTADNQETNISQAEIRLTLGNGEQHTTTIRQNGTTSAIQYPEQDRARLFPLFGYGCRRGSALAGGAREVKLADNDGPEISTLFDDDADLIHAETWLRILESDAQKDEQYDIIFKAVKAALIKFLDLTDVEIKVGGGVWITEKTGLKLPFKDLSDGYLTSAGWFLDLIARWIELAKQNQAVIDADFMTQMRGLVLIDEIDLHLHPRWQIEIIDRTRKLLPQMSFIVTTHNPLTLVGAKAQEIWIMERINGRIQAKIQGDTPMLLTGGQIYRRFFGIEDIYPNGLGAALQRYSFLTGFALRTDAEQAELETLQTQLAQAEIKPDWDIVPRQIAALPAPAEPPAPALRKPRAKKAKEPK